MSNNVAASNTPKEIFTHPAMILVLIVVLFYFYYKWF